MDYVKCNAFLCVVRLGSLTKAAKKLGYTQSGISHMLNALEHKCDMQLLYRDRSGVRLTSDGKALLPYFESICARQHELNLIIDELHDGTSGLIRIAANPSIAGQWLPQIFRDFHKTHPKVKFELHEVLTSYEVNHLVNRKAVDCGFYVGSSPNRTQPTLYIEQLMAVLSPEHELAGAKCFPMHALDAYPYISVDESVEGMDTYSACIARIFAKHDKTPQITLHVISEYTALAMIAANQGYCILPNLSKDKTKHELVYLPLEEPFFRYIGLVVAKDRQKIKTIQSFIEKVCTWAEKINAANGFCVNTLDI